MKENEFYLSCRERFEEAGVELLNLRNDIEDWNEMHQDDEVDKFYKALCKLCDKMTNM